MNDKIAIVVDRSGSIELTAFNIFTLRDHATWLTLEEPYAQADIQELITIAQNFKKVYYFTDGVFTPQEDLMIKIQGNIELITL